MASQEPTKTGWRSAWRDASTEFADRRCGERTRGARRILPNCPRHIYRMAVTESSPYVPRVDYTPPAPKWKTFESFRDVLPRGDPARGGRETS